MIQTNIAERRRKILRGMCLGMFGVWFTRETSGMQIQGTRPQNNTDSSGREDNDTPPAFGHKAALEQNEKDIKKKIERLFQLATELKDEVEKTDSAKVLSVVMLRKAEEIEKLAKDIRTRAKG